MSVLVRCLWVLLAALPLAAPAWAQEACTQSEIEGVWDLYIGLGDDDGDDGDDILEDDGWSACRIRVEPEGAVSGPCVTAGRASFRIVDGQLEVRDSCRVAGRFAADVEGDNVTLAVPRATLSQSGDLIAGGTRGRVGDDVVSALFQMIRR
jgi:hypothetical protein